MDRVRVCTALGLMPEARYRETHSWRRARREALVRDEWTCRDCGVTDWDARLVVHHVEPVLGYDASCAHHLVNLRTLCTACHARAHRGQRVRLGTQLALDLAA